MIRVLPLVLLVACSGDGRPEILTQALEGCWKRGSLLSSARRSFNFFAPLLLQVTLNVQPKHDKPSGLMGRHRHV